MTKLNTKRYDLNGYDVDLETRKAHALRLMEAVQQDDRRTMKEYIQSKELQDEFIRLKNEDAQRFQQMMESYKTDQLARNVSNNAFTNEQNRFAQEYMRQQIALQVYRDAQMLQQQMQQSQRMHAIYMQQQKQVSMETVARERQMMNQGQSTKMCNNTHYAMAMTHSLKAYASNNTPQQRIAMQAYIHADQNLPRNATLKKSFGQNENIRWMEHPSQVMNKSKLRYDAARAFNQSDGNDQSLNRFVARHDCVDTGMPKGYYRKLQDTTATMERAQLLSDKQAYNRAANNLDTLGATAKEHSYYLQKTGHENNLVQENMKSFDKASLSQNQQVQQDAIARLKTGYNNNSPQNNVDLNASKARDMVSRSLADTAANDYLNRKARQHAVPDQVQENYKKRQQDRGVQEPKVFIPAPPSHQPSQAFINRHWEDYQIAQKQREYKERLASEAKGMGMGDVKIYSMNPKQVESLQRKVHQEIAKNPERHNQWVMQQNAGVPQVKTHVEGGLAKEAQMKINSTAPNQNINRAPNQGQVLTKEQAQKRVVQNRIQNPRQPVKAVSTPEPKRGSRPPSGPSL